MELATFRDDGAPDAVRLGRREPCTRPWARGLGAWARQSARGLARGWLVARLVGSWARGWFRFRSTRGSMQTTAQRSRARQAIAKLPIGVMRRCPLSVKCGPKLRQPRKWKMKSWKWKTGKVHTLGKVQKEKLEKEKYWRRVCGHARKATLWRERCLHTPHTLTACHRGSPASVSLLAPHSNHCFAAQLVLGAWRSAKPVWSLEVETVRRSLWP